MKIIITENQYFNLKKNIYEENQTPDFEDINKFVKYWKNLIGNDDNVNTNNDSEFSSYISSGDDLMNPLGEKKPISSKFGLRNIGIRGASRSHKGIDISTPSGSKVYSPADGIIIDAKDTSPNGCGGFIKINHQKLGLITKFCHLRQWLVSPNQQVKKGQLIGYTGGSKTDPHRGTSTGAHLHYEILNNAGIAQNPLSVQSNLV